MQITRDYEGKSPVVAPAMRGALMFYADLIRRIRLDIICDLVWVSTYGAERSSSGRIDLVVEPRENWSGRDVVLVEDIVDTGRTGEFLLSMARGRGARTVRLCTLLDKPSRRVCEVRPDYIGFTIPDEFVVGYGLDCGGLGRNLEYVGTLG